MNRRRVLAITLTGGLSAVLAAPPLSISHRGTGQRSFFVAGVRYQTILDPPAPGTSVRLIRAEWRGEPCLEVHALGGVRLGYVPRSVLSTVLDMDVQDAHLIAVDRDAVPWKRYQVTVFGST